MSQFRTTRSHLWQLQQAMVLLLAALFIVFLYTFLHEGGHALVGVWAGGIITNFNVSFLDLRAHVDMAGQFTPAQTVANNLAGACLPLVVWLGFMLVVPKRANLALESIKVVGSFVFLSTLLAWVIRPLLFWAGQARSDDIDNFLRNSGVHPLWATFVAVLMYISGWLVFAAKVDGLRREIDLFRKVNAEVMTPAVRTTTWSMISLFVFCGLVAFAVNGYKFSAPRTNSFQPPPGYTLVRQIDLDRDQHTQSIVYTFVVDAPTTVGVYLLIEGIDSAYFEVRLTGPDHYNHLIVHGEGYTAAKDNPHMEELLQAGEYRCILTSEPSPGILSIYTKESP